MRVYRFSLKLFVAVSFFFIGLVAATAISTAMDYSEDDGCADVRISDVQFPYVLSTTTIDHRSMN